MKIDYNKFWEENISSHAHHPSVRLRNTFILNSLSALSFESVMDIGCGDGELIRILRTRFEEKYYAGMDISDSIITKNRINISDVDFYVGDVGSDTFQKDKQYDIVICSEVIEHISDWEMVIENMASLTNSAGYCILTTQSGKRYKSDLNIGHLKHFELRELEEKFQKHGFNVKKSYKKGWPFYNLQKWLYEKIEDRAKGIQHGKITLLSKILFHCTYFLFHITPRTKSLGPQIFMVLQKK